MKASQESSTRCEYCLEPTEQPKVGRRRRYCSAACRQKAYRYRQGKRDRAWHRRQREEEALLAAPFVERVMDVMDHQPLYVRSDGKRVYRCLACGKVYVATKRTPTGRRHFCSNRCQEKARYHWKRLIQAQEKLMQRNSRAAWEIAERTEQGMLSPICPVCQLPFVPNSGRPGRPRKYCSDKCCKQAYERRWKIRKGGLTARRHRTRLCAECGVKFDRTDAKGGLTRRYCSERCGNKQRRRTYELRKKGLLPPAKPASQSNKRRKRNKGRKNEQAQAEWERMTDFILNAGVNHRADGAKSEHQNGKRPDRRNSSPDL